ADAGLLAMEPRQVTTVAELEALPVGSIIKSSAGYLYERDYVDHDHCLTDGDEWYPIDELADQDTFPATVLYVPREGAGTSPRRPERPERVNLPGWRHHFSAT